MCLDLLPREWGHVTVLGVDYWMRAVSDLASAFAREKDRLCQLDGAIGDGDHGVSMMLGFTAACSKLREQRPADVGGVLNVVGHAFISSVGGVTGIIFGTLFVAAGRATAGRTEIAPHDLAVMFSSALDAVKAKGTASEGDKTMVDALAPAVASLNQAMDEGAHAAEALSRAAQSAEQGMLSTSPMLAQRGRARYQGDRARGHVDAGAASIALIFQTLASTASSGCAGGGDGAANGIPA